MTLDLLLVILFAFAIGTKKENRLLVSRVCGAVQRQVASDV